MPDSLSVATPAPSRLNDEYLPLPDRFDEMRAADGTLRPHWQYLLDALRALGSEGIDARWREARRMIRDHGVTYNIYGDPRGMSRPWELDPLPLLLRGEEWTELERGLIQRAELLDQILRDLYGPRTLIDKGLLPATLTDGYSGYLLPCHGIEMAGQRPLTLYAADLTRDAAGHWQVIGDRTQSPSGAGYALENRVVLSRVLPSLYRDSHVHRLAGFFRSLRRALLRLAPRREERARIAVLTPGPSNEAYFEHAYLAGYLGYPLVQGADLTVRDGALWLRTLGRLERIDALLRRVDDGWCDPLELREDSLLGVPGLLAAVRTGNLAVANGLGSGVLEHPGLMAFLPRLCEALLGEELQLPHLRTWWCGTRAERNYVLEHLETLVIKPAGGGAQRHLFGKALSLSELDALRAEIRAEPQRFAAQEEVLPATAPVYLDARLEPRPFVLRVFAVAEEEGYAIMPGGLGRVALARDQPLAVNQLGGLGKDIWVLATEPERQETLLGGVERTKPAVVRESQVSSRVADNLFWIGRYAERAEGLVRLLRATILKLSDRFSFTAANVGENVCNLHALLRALTHQTQTYPGFVGAGAEALLAEPTPEILALASDLNRIGSLPQTLQALVQAAWSVRHRLSADTWRIVNDIEKRLHALTKFPPQALGGVLDAIDPLITLLVAFAGLAQENMTHNEGWHFLEIGRRIERGANLATLLRATMGTVFDELEETLTVEAVLTVTDSTMTYRRRYQGGTRVGAVLDLVFQDETNPRSLAYQMLQLQRLIDELPRTEGTLGRSLAQKLILRLLTESRLTEIDPLVNAAGEGVQRAALTELLRLVEEQLAALSDALTAQYLQHEEMPHNLIEQRTPVAAREARP